MHHPWQATFKHRTDGQGPFTDAGGFTMGAVFLFTLRHNKSAYYTDFAATTVVVLMAAWLLQSGGRPCD
jgi:hypothetical protein